MPRRSTGCEKCRKRKVRCDGARPGCQRCTDYGITCPGYRPPAEKDLHFVDQTKHVARKSGNEVVPLSRNHQQEKQNTQYRFRNQFSGDIVDTRPAVLNSTHLQRAQLLSTFLDLYLPKQRDPKKISHFAYLTALPNIDLSSPLLQIVVDTVCLVELGSLYDDERCLQESRSRYVRALPMLSTELMKPKARQLAKDTLLGAITLLSMCELFDAIAKNTPSGQGWISHVQGAQQFIQANGPEVIKSPFGWLLFHNIRHSSLCMGLVKRKAIFCGEPKWLKLTESLSRTDPFIALYDLVDQAPGLLERADKLTHSLCFDEDFKLVCNDITRLRTELEEWQDLHYSVRPYSILNILEMSEFTMLCPNRTFTTAFSFDNVQVCSQMQLFWIICLMLDFTIANIYRLHGKQHQLPDTSTFTPRSKKQFWKDMYTNAENYCRTTPYCCDPATASAGRIGTFLLRIVQSFFEIAGHTEELQWCLDVRKMFEQSTVRPPASAPPRPTPPNEANENFKIASRPPLTIEGEYPNSGYNPRRPRERSEIYQDENVNNRKKRVWPPSFGGLPQADLTGPVLGAGICPSDSPVWSSWHMHQSQPSQSQSPSYKSRIAQPDPTDPLLNPPQVLGLPSERLRRDLNTPPVHGRRWNVSTVVAAQASRALHAGFRHEHGAAPSFQTFDFASSNMTPESSGERQSRGHNGTRPWADELTAQEDGGPYYVTRNRGDFMTLPTQDVLTDSNDEMWRVSEDMSVDGLLGPGSNGLDELHLTSGAVDDLDDLRLLPDGEARKGPIGAMCF